MQSVSNNPGNMPIKVLAYNMLNKFTQEGLRTIPQFKEAIEKGLVNPGLKYCIEEKSLKSPFANCESRQIVIQEVFLSFMWAFSYSLFVIQEKGIQERVTKPQWRGEIIFDTKLLINANELLAWALTLNIFYSDWEPLSPNPEKPNDIEEKFYSEKVNGIYENATCYILFHEFAHLVLDHCEYSNSLKGKEESQLSPEELDKFKELEAQADGFAFNALINGAENQTEKFYKGVAIIIAHCAMLFMLHNPKKVKQLKHPDTDKRLENAINNLKLEDPLNEDYIWTIGCFACMKFFSIHNILVSISPKDPKPLFMDYMAEFEKLKY